MSIDNRGTHRSRNGLDTLGLTPAVAHWNYTTPQLYEAALERREVKLSREGAIVARTGQHTGRSPNDKFVVEEPSSKANIWWGKVNRPISDAHFRGILKKMKAHLAGEEVFVQDCWCGAERATRLPIRIITRHAWHNLFARNMFLRASVEEISSFAPGFTVIQAPECRADPKVDGTRSETFIVVHMAEKLILIGGSSYAGEIKKSVFSIMNYLLPPQGVMPMHCSANASHDGQVALFFGLSGTGKTTLSADATRMLIGDDEHGWSERGVFNFENGCYAKVIDLSPEAEPEIHAASHRFGAILENVVMDEGTRAMDLFDKTHTENTRSSYPLSFIPNASRDGLGGHPEHIVMLTADAFGVLPPISRLTPEQAMYHFLSGYTARVAGTERGLGSEPQATFSTCFGAPFMPRHPTVYADLLGKNMTRHKASCWLVNTGWTGGGYGTGERMKLAYTRAMLRAALSGNLTDVGFEHHPAFGLTMPRACPDVPAEVLNPRHSWSDKGAYDNCAREVAGRFEKNFVQFEGHVDAAVREQAIRAA